MFLKMMKQLRCCKTRVRNKSNVSLRQGVSTENVHFQNRPFSYSKNESGSNDISIHFVQFSNVHDTDRSSDTTQSNLVYKNV